KGPSEPATWPHAWSPVFLPPPRLGFRISCFEFPAASGGGLWGIARQRGAGIPYTGACRLPARRWRTGALLCIRYSPRRPAAGRGNRPGVMGARTSSGPRRGLLRALAARAARFGVTLKFRLMLLLTAVLLLVVGLPVALFVHHLDRNYEEFSTTMLEVTTGFVYRHLADALVADDSVGVQRSLEQLAGDP